MFLQTRDALTLTKHVQRGAYIGIYTTRPRVKHICSSIFLWWKVIHVVITRRHLEWWFHFWQNQDHCVAGKLNECFPRWHTLMCIRFTTARYKGISANFRLWLRRKAMRRSRLSFIRHCYTLHNSSWSDLGFQHMVCTDIYSAVWVGFTAHLTDLNPNSNLCSRIHWKTPKVHNMCIIIDNCFCSYSSPLLPSSPLAHNRKQPWDFGPRPLPFSVCGAYWSVLSMPWPSSQQWPQRRSHLVKSP